MKTWGSLYDPFDKNYQIAPYYQQTLWFGFNPYGGSLPTVSFGGYNHSSAPYF